MPNITHRATCAQRPCYAGLAKSHPQPTPLPANRSQRISGSQT
jgi:hypothetical protein